MKLFAKIVLICNISFIIFVLLGYIEFSQKKSRGGESIMPLPFITGTFVILGELAVFVNLIFCCVTLLLLLSKKVIQVPQWLLIVNFIFLMLQLYYFFT